MNIFAFETQGPYRAGGMKVIVAKSKEEAEQILLDDERAEIKEIQRIQREGLQKSMPEGVGLPEEEFTFSDEAILKDWVLVKEGKFQKGIVWKTGGVMFA